MEKIGGIELTEKRFTYEYDEYNGNLFDNKMNTFYHIEDSDENIKVLCDRLNLLVDENEQLKQQLSEQGTQIDFLKDENIHMRNVLNENKQLKQTCQMVEDTYHALQKKFHNWDIALDKCQNENKELKKQISYYEKLITDKEVE